MDVVVVVVVVVAAAAAAAAVVYVNGCTMFSAYPVVVFGGTKRMILSTTSWLGGKNPFLGVAYIVVGSMCILIGFIFLIVHLRIGQR